MLVMQRLANVCWIAGFLLIGYFCFRFIPFAWQKNFCESVYAEEKNLYAEVVRISNAEEQEYDNLENTLKREEQRRIEELEGKKKFGKFWFPIEEIRPAPLFRKITDLPRRSGFDQDLKMCNERLPVLEDEGMGARIFGGIGVLLIIVCYVLSGKFIPSFRKSNFQGVGS